MIRFTARNEAGGITVDNKGGQAFERLAYYEDLFEQGGDELTKAMRLIKAICVSRTDDDACTVGCPCRQVCTLEPYNYNSEVI